MSIITSFIAFALSVLGPFCSATNFSVDLLGPVDQRGSTWGNADAHSWAITFKPPVGYRVRILRLSGDLVAWPKVLPGEFPVADGAYAGVLLGLQTTAPQGSTRCELCADNTMLYVQGAIDSHPIRVPFDQRVSAGGMLGTDNKLVVKVAAWLNTTGKPIHMEPTFTVTYRFEPEGTCAPG
jgi:hypothetical protein